MSSNSEIVTITGMDPKFYQAAVEGNMDEFRGKDEEFIMTILTPNKNTILHVHLTASSESVSERFVEEILGMCPTLLVKVNAKGETLLHIAARYGHSIIVEKLIEKAKSLPLAEKTLMIRAISDTKDTALHEAVVFKHIEIVDILTKEDPHISNFANSDGETPLYVAIEREYWNVAQKILDNCNSPNQDGPNGRTALHAAIVCNNQDMVSKLLTRTSVNQADENGWVPLHLAASRKSPDIYIMEELLRYDRNTAYKKDKKGRTAFHFAAHHGHEKVMEKIIEYCPDCAELVDEKGYNALHYTSIGRQPYAARLILDNTSLSNLYNQKDNNGNTPFHHFARTPKFYNSKFYVRWSHPLMEKDRSRVDTMAFNKQNQKAIDIAYDHPWPRRGPNEIKEQQFAIDLRKICGRMGGRISLKKKSEEKDTVERNEKARETSMVVATLIATVTFAAGFTVPGGFVQEHDQHDKGSPILKHNRAFQAFVITNTFSFVLSTIAVVLGFLLPFNSQMKNKGWYEYDHFLVSFVTMYAMVFMMIAFGTGTYAILGVSKALVVVTLLIVLSFFCYVYAIFCLPLLDAEAL
ncbi:ankyrin repeat-containing protein [Senna tora]|uniref:Ankyrin repeat-containing protein n=1 Tax=Senna tora TaxID=362788 RepID=A0A834W415_9FABA|nr:ankyrin repeat-containing protein [Senna tora]